MLHFQVALTRVCIDTFIWCRKLFWPTL